MAGGNWILWDQFVGKNTKLCSGTWIWSSIVRVLWSKSGFILIVLLLHQCINHCRAAADLTISLTLHWCFRWNIATLQLCFRCWIRGIHLNRHMCWTMLNMFKDSRMFCFDWLSSPIILHPSTFPGNPFTRSPDVSHQVWFGSEEFARETQWERREAAMTWCHCGPMGFLYIFCIQICPTIHPAAHWNVRPYIDRLVVEAFSRIRALEPTCLLLQAPMFVGNYHSSTTHGLVPTISGYDAPI